MSINGTYAKCIRSKRNNYCHSLKNSYVSKSAKMKLLTRK